MFNFVLNYNLFAMSDLNKELESMLGDMGMSVSDSPEPQAEQDTKPQEEQMQFPVQEAVEETVIEETVIEETQQEAAVETMPKQDLKEETPEEDVEAKTLSYLSERLGREVTSFDELLGTQNTPVEINEQVAVINEFVKNTGRSVEDWFAYQAMNPSEMDDLTAIKMSMTSEYPDLDGEEIEMLVGSKYKLDEDLYTDDEIKLSKLQLKIEANKSRKSIEQLRSSYTLPEAREAQTVQSPIDDNWIKSMTEETNALEALTFELPEGEFNFGITDEYKSQLIDKNSNIETFFDQYISQDGQWDYDTFNTHRAVVDNIDAIAKNIYQQGLSDGQRKIVDQAANVSTKSPNVGTGKNNTNSLERQILDALNVDKTLKFL